jgi:carboxyl-terminal processing protease
MYNEVLLPGDLAYISIEHFESDAGVKAFERAFPTILKARGLIIDVRKNGGGNSGFGVQLLRFLTNEPIPGPISYSRTDKGLLRNDQRIIEWKPTPFSGAVDTETRPLVFSGPVAVLTGARTFSAGEDFVAAFRTIARGRTVGGATGGSTGQPIWVKLPGGGKGRICAKRDTFADGTSFVGKGLKPDVPVNPSLADFFSGRDVVLERAIAELSLSMPPKSKSAF